MNDEAKEWLQWINMVISAISALAAVVAVRMVRTVHVMVNSRMGQMISGAQAEGRNQERASQDAKRKRSYSSRKRS